MKFLKNPKFLIFLIVFINFLGYGMVFPLLPLITESYGGNPLISGVLIASFSVMQMIAMPILGRLSDRYGRKPMLLFSLWGTVVSFLMMAFTHSIFWLLVARIIDGASGGNLSIAQAYMADKTEKQDRAGGMGIIAAGLSLGFIFGPLWGGIFTKISPTAPFFTASLLTFVSIIFTTIYLPESIKKAEIEYEKKHFSLKEFIRHELRPVLLILFVINLLFFWAQSGVFTVLSLFGKDILRISFTKLSLVLAFGGIVSATIQGFAIKPVIKFVGEKKLFFLSAILGFFGMMILSVANSVWILFIGFNIMNVGISFLTPVTQSLVSENSGKHEQGGSLGLMQSFGSMGRIFGPISAGFIYQTISPFSPAVMGAVIFILILIFGLYI